MPCKNVDSNIVRFQKRVLQSGPNECWQWTGSIEVQGYAILWTAEQRHVKALRWYLEYLNGPIAEGCEVDHLCRNRSCVNPNHAQVVTKRENILRGIGPTAVNAQKTHCKRNHPLLGENLYIYKDGRRECRTCSKEYKSNWSKNNAKHRHDAN